MKICVLGGDGYCGWATALYLSRQGHTVSIVDSFVRRQWDFELGLQTLTPIRPLPERLRAWKRLTGIDIQASSGDITDYGFLAEVIAREMGCEVVAAYDVGVAGLHRLAEPLRRFKERRVDVVVVAAGMDGALPSVVSGLVDVPVIGLPTSIGYGLGGRGVAALLSMLQTCAPGLTVVNIDNGIGAGATAALITNRVAAARRAAAEAQPG